MDEFNKDRFLRQIHHSMGRWILFCFFLMLAWAVFVEIYMRIE